MPIANMDSTAADGVLLKSTLLSAASVTSPLIGSAGTVVNEVSTSFDGGLNPGEGANLCKVSFDNIDADDRLAYEGQICIDVTTVNCAQNDEGAIVTQTEGIALAAATYLWAMEDSVGGDQGRLYITTANAARSNLYGTDTLLEAFFLTIDKEEFTTICCWWRGNEWGILADGGEVASGTRQTAHPANNFYKLILGTAHNTTSLPFITGRLKNLIVSYVSPRLRPPSYGTISLLGDSYVVQLTNTNDGSYYRDISAIGLINNRLSKQGLKPIIYSNSDGGASIGDSAANNLSDLFDTWAEESSGVVWLIAFNNDYTITSAERNHVTTGTEANAQKLLKLLGGELATAAGHTYNKVSKVVLCTGGSMTNNVAVGTDADNIIGKTETDVIVNSLPSWWDAAYPAKAGFVEIFDLFTALGGDSETNIHYQGYLDTFGNETQAPVTPQADRHPSSHGKVVMVDGMLEKTHLKII